MRIDIVDANEGNTELIRVSKISSALFFGFSFPSLRLMLFLYHYYKKGFS